jgi:hypothetical protein
MPDQYTEDKHWLIDNGFSTINHEEFSDRVTRTMEDNATYDCLEAARNSVAIDMLMEQ